MPCNQKGNRCRLHRGRNKEKAAESDNLCHMNRRCVGSRDVCDGLLFYFDLILHLV